MKKINVKNTKNFDAYGLTCYSLFPKILGIKPPIGSMLAIVEPLQTSIVHNHHETELFYIVKGKGIVRCNSEEFDVEEGDLISLPAFSEHTISNLSESDNLEFLTFWWEQLQDIHEELEKLDIPVGKKILVTATPPTPNGDLHLGHMSGPYLGADIFSRFLKFQGNNVFYLSGTDLNQTYVKTKAIQKNISPEKLARDNTNAIKDTLSKAYIEYDAFYNPLDMEEYNNVIQEFFLELYEGGNLIIKAEDEYFDGDKNLHEAYINGGCPHCNSSSDGNCCEKCGLPHKVMDLKSPKSFYSGTLEKRTIEKLYFPLERFKNDLLSYYEKINLEPHHRYYIDKLFSEKLPDIAVSHLSCWGINHIIPNFKEHIIYVWAEMLPAYLFSTKKYSNINWEEYEYKIQFFGFDNTFYHLVLFPAMLIANKQTKCLPDRFIINEFLYLDGNKFSTSREHLIWARDFFNEHPTDIVRMYLAKVRPEKSVRNFSIKGYNSFEKEFVKNGLLNNLSMFWDIFSRYNNEIPEPGAWDMETKKSYKLIIDAYRNIVESHQYKTFSTHSIMMSLDNLNNILNTLCNIAYFIKDSDRDESLMRTILALLALVLKVISISLIGIAPNFSSRLMNELNTNISIENDLAFLPAGTILLPYNKSYLVD